MFSDSWDEFSAGVAEVRFLLGQGAEASLNLAIGEKYSKQQVYVRAAIVLLTAHIEGFFKSLADEFGDTLEKSWDGLLPGTRRYVLLASWRRLVDELEGNPDEQFLDARRVDAARRAIVQASRYLTRPSALSSSTYRSELRGFYRLRGAKAVERFTSDFAANGDSVFDTLARNGLDRGSYWTVLEGLVEARNQIAHGGSFSLTLGDLRNYVAKCIVLARQTRRHLSGR